MVEIDGSMGEGGGQVLRTALTLAAITGRSLHIQGIRGRRRRAGLLSQHLTAVRATAELCGARVEGAELRSRELVFHPGSLRPGAYRHDIGTAGSVCLVLQAVLPALTLAPGPSQLHLRGGTHNGMAPPVHFLDRVLVPLLGRMGVQVHLDLHRWGFYPRGGGVLGVHIEPAGRFLPLHLVDRGAVRAVRATAVVAGLPRHIARRELQVVRRMLPGAEVEVEVLDRRQGPGNVLMVEVECAGLTELFTGFGTRGLPAEQVAAGVCEEVDRWLAAGVPVGEHLADQLVLPLALAGSGRFRTTRPSSHTLTNLEVVGRFLEVELAVEERAGSWEVRAGGP